MAGRTRSPLSYLPPAERTLVQSFFAEFAFAEFQLKSLGYIQGGREEAKADWDAFAKSIARPFAAKQSPEFTQAWKTLTSAPPRKQVVVKGRLGWKSTSRPPGLSDAAWGLLLVRRIRNNLFHGAKFIVGGAEQFGRDRDLVAAAQSILESAIQLAGPRKRGAA